ncbi:MAG: MOSC domain-containing protein [Gammaproteobacteria bacterium]|nr:MAG: MOSC domain-containing protein [Gammaproteobacteria bacterium]
MKVVSINRGRKRRLEGRSFRGSTGIFKEPVAEPVVVGELGLEADAVCNTRHHGGPDQAVYLYREEDYGWWSDQLGRQLAPGTFGDNLTVRGLPDPGLVIGSRLRLPDLLLEVTAPRIPCNTLAQRMNDPSFAKAFMRAERPGVYLRVIEAGSVRAGDGIELERYAGDQLTTVDLFRDSHRKLEAEMIRRYLAVPIDIRTRSKFEAELNR